METICKKHLLLKKKSNSQAFFTAAIDMGDMTWLTNRQFQVHLLISPRWTEESSLTQTAVKGDVTTFF